MKIENDIVIFSVCAATAVGAALIIATRSRYQNPDDVEKNSAEYMMMMLNQQNLNNIGKL